MELEVETLRESMTVDMKAARVGWTKMNGTKIEAAGSWKKMTADGLKKMRIGVGLMTNMWKKKHKYHEMRNDHDQRNQNGEMNN